MRRSIPSAVDRAIVISERAGQPLPRWCNKGHWLHLSRDDGVFVAVLQSRVPSMVDTDRAVLLCARIGSAKVQLGFLAERENVATLAVDPATRPPVQVEILRIGRPFRGKAKGPSPAFLLVRGPIS